MHWQGLPTVDESIYLLNPQTDWIQNCNSTPFTSAAQFSPKKEDYPGYMTSYPENFRGIHALAVLDTAGDVSLDGLIDIGYDSYLPGAQKLMDPLADDLGSVSRSDPDLAGTYDILKDWDYRVSKEEAAMTICHFYYEAYYRSGKLSGMGRMGRYDYMANSEPEEKIEILKDALNQLKEDFGGIDIHWGKFNRYQRLNGDIRQIYDDEKPSIPMGLASGSWGALASYGARRGADTKRQYGSSGNSFVAVVEFGEKVVAKSLLAGGQSGDPDSPHFDDQAQRYADAEFKDVAFYREDVKKRAVRGCRPGE